MKTRMIFTGFMIITAIIFAGAGSAHALFDDYEIVSGDISVDRGVNSVIVNVNSDKAIVNINSFNVGLNETIQFNGSNSELLTRVTGGEMSRIDGNLYSNLMLFALINTAGIHISDTGNIEARNLILSMRDITNNNFLNSEYFFEKFSQSETEFLLLNEGAITITNGGFGILIAGAIDNKGIISARLGKIHLASGDAVRVVFDGDGLIGVAVEEGTAATILDLEGNPITDQIKNTGTIAADGGRVFMEAKSVTDVLTKAINLEGIVRATRIEEKDGLIRLVADKEVAINTTLEATRVEIIAPSVIGAPDITHAIGDVLRVEARYVDITSEVLTTEIVAEADLTVEEVIDLEELDMVTIVGENFGEVTYLKTNNITLESPRGDVNTVPGVFIPGYQVKLSGQHIGSYDNPVGINADVTYINRLQGEIDVSEMWGLGSTLMIRGPAPQPDTDPWGAVSYNSDSLLVLEAEKITSSSSDPLYLFGNITFSNLEITVPGKEIYFEAGKTTTILGTWKIEGAYGEHVRLLSSVQGEQWYVDPQGEIDISYAWVEDSYSYTLEKIVMTESTNRGNSVGWDPTAYWFGKGNTVDARRWSLAANWTGIGGATPGAGDAVVFQGKVNTVSENGTSNIDAIFTIGSLSVNTGYTKVLTVANALTITTSSGETGSYFQADGTVTLEAGVSVGGSWNKTGGTFNAGTATVDFTGTAAAVISGDTTFNNFTCTAAGKTLSFSSGSTQTVGGALTITGASGNLITLARSGGTDPDQWNINVTGTSSVSYASVSNSNATGNTILAPDSTNGGNNTNWGFAGDPYYLKITGSASMTAGGSNNVTITAYDAFDDLATSYAGDKSITFSGAAAAPDGTNPTASDKDANDVNFGTATTITFTNGAGTSVMKLYKAESAEVEVTDGTISSAGDPSYDLNVTVASGSAGYLKITGTATMTAGGSNELTITASDDYGNAVTSYAGAKDLTFSGLSNAPAGNVPTVESVDLGSVTSVNFTAGISDANAATLIAYKAETASLNVTDGTIGSSGDPNYELDLTVTAGAKDSLSWATQPSSPVTAGATWPSFSIEIVDAYGNRTADNGISIKLTPSSGTLSGTTTQSSVAGLATYDDISCTTAATITLVGASSGAWKESTPASNPVTIKADVAAYMTITSPSSATIAGVSITATITAFDQYDNVATDYVGDKNITFSGATASPNPVTEPTASDKNAADIDFGTGTAMTFTAGAGTTTIKLYKVETALINVTDGVISSTGAPQYKLDVNVSVAAASKLLWVTAPTTTSAKVGDTWANSVSIEVTDPWGNRTNDIVAVTIENSQGAFSGGTTTKNTVASFVTFDDLTYEFRAKGTVNFYGSAAGLESTPFAAVTVEPVWIDPGTIYIMLPDFVYGIEGFFPASLLYDLFAEILWYIDVDGMGAIVNISEDQSDKKKKPRSVKKGGLSWIEVIKKRWEGRVSPSSN